MDELKTRINKALEKFNIEEKQKKIKEIELESSAPDFWKDHKNASQKMKDLSNLQNEILNAQKLLELSKSGDLTQAEKLLNDFETLLYFSGVYDNSQAIISLHA